ncbi:cytochrome C oxidase subunit IV family protein [Fluviicola sp.]|jgi:caa(3)-type oxidase subunit IV|uniref:cytochrome C oxidase subunit IV family protein n=1 Tax=Fluviicola sp. TaxID=1917219 RepID=UPI0028208478|nr:cytochrome C oxidase subunit IV family protein [Fluviicola sp.]MDR0801412.1 cytochrome C oxidase subunit IV family protein [Fluviicola sp.]
MERDDIIEYSLDAHHSEEVGKKIRRKILLVTAILTVITAFEVAVGALVHQDSPAWKVVKLIFIALTLLKAGYIVLVFMHLGDEKKILKYCILVPYFIFIIYLIFISLTEANAVHTAWETYGG